MSGIYGNGVSLTEKMLDYLWTRETVTLNNIANVDTPGFKSQYITFEDELSRRLSAPDRRKRWGRQSWSSTSPGDSSGAR